MRTSEAHAGTLYGGPERYTNMQSMFPCSPVEHVPVCLYQSAHEQGVEGTGSNVWLTGGWVTGVEVVRGSRDGRVGKSASNRVR